MAYSETTLAVPPPQINKSNLFFTRWLRKPGVYIGAMFLVTAFAVYLCAGILVFEPGNYLYPACWLAGFGFVIFGVAYCFVCSIYAIFIRPENLPEAPLSSLPRTAILYPVLNETFGLFERMSHSLSNNDEEGIDLWVLSDSPADQEILSYESEVVTKLREKFGEQRIHYWRRKHPTERKQGNIKGWLDNHKAEYPYFIVCDADTILGRGVIRKLLAKANHPANAGIAIFQSCLHVAHARTYFAKFQASSAPLAQRLYVAVNQAIFGRALYFGHAGLIRSDVFAKIQLPLGIASHDIWETAILDRMGYRVAFCLDVVNYEEVPANYLEMRARDRRWAKGNLQTPPLLWAKGLSLATRFYVFYGLYIYICQPVFLAWLFMGFFGGSLLEGKMLSFQRYAFVGASVVDLEMTSMLIGVMLVVFFHKMVIARSWREVGQIIREIFLSTALCLNNVFYQTLDMLLLPFGKWGWIPMNKNPNATLELADAARQLWPSTVLGIVGLYFGCNYSPHWVAGASVFLISFGLGIPIAYLTGQASGATT